ncbi:Glycosyltransferase, GT2 family [Prosthecobacter debontii]|uniref:Glycosyltransferase, GT2 family n=1 Tax=Prosthecobacter debontii TaxID=48467 RepID=A0A1T4YD90_9BACT|nr:glycosyltransferase family 2 protein [Prosthecobacter debontii]SKA99724.1 Glycosyltransferase, GT2 family [Prosthecobacter debontii]
MNPSITIIITQREAFAPSRESLESVLAHTPAPFDLIYIDGASPPTVRDHLRMMAEKYGFRLLRQERFLSPNEAKCLALPLIQSDYAVFIDNDVLVQPGWLEALVNCAEETQAGAVAPLYQERLGSEEKLHMLGGRCYIKDDNQQRCFVLTHDQRKGSLKFAATSRFQTEHIEMHAFLVRADLLQKHELFDPQIPSLPENGDFCLTLLKASVEIWIEPKARVTVLLPERVHDDDRAFFTTRWSDAWVDQGFQRFTEKWQLRGAQPVLESQRRWSVAHRVIAYPDSWHRRLKVKSDSILNRRLLAPLEHHWLNR